MKIDWKKKLTSRKFWAAVVGFITSLAAAFGLGDNDIAQITGVIMSGAVLIAYIIGEGLVDKAAVSQMTDERGQMTDNEAGSDVEEQK